MSGTALVHGIALSGVAVAFSFMQDGATAEFKGTVDGDRIHGTLTRDGRSVDYVGSRR